MSAFLYPKFLSDIAEYAQAEARWAREWASLLKAERQEWLWESPWLKNSFADGEACRDGNPIFSAYSPRLRLGARVIQIEPEGTQRELYAWVDTFGKGEAEAITELVVTCVLTEQTLLDVLDLFKSWLRDGRDVVIPVSSPQFDGPRLSRPRARTRRIEVVLS